MDSRNIGTERSVDILPVCSSARMQQNFTMEAKVLSVFYLSVLYIILVQECVCSFSCVNKFKDLENL